jgi:diguanylate cyclase (GGDEF)-like protein/PAS domain S-box-containing protein
MDDDLFQVSESFLLNALMDNVADAIYFKDRRCRLVRVSRQMAGSLGLKDSSQLIGKTDKELFGEDFGRRTMIDDLRVMETGEPIIGLVESRELPGGELNWTSTTKLPLRGTDGEIVGLLGITREINELKRVELDLQYLATHDTLTGLPNRYLFYDRLEQTLRRTRRSMGRFAVLYIDLDGFKMINDHYGHDLGDQVLKQVGARLQGGVRDSDTAARIGGDEFAVLLDIIHQPEDAAMVAQHLRESIEVKFDLLATQVSVTASIGISLFPDHGSDAVSLVKAADQAMYEAKKRNNACAFYSPPQMPL